MSLKFGTSGLRGLSTDLVGKASAVYATAFVRHLANKGWLAAEGRVLIGMDFRPSSPEIVMTCAGALAAEGYAPVDCGALPTPALAFKAISEKAPALMVTGSHIPADRNGIKFYRPDGEIDKQDELEISRIAAEIFEDQRFVMAAPLHGVNESVEAMQQFTRRNRALLPVGSLSGLRIGVYQHSTVARDLFVELLGHAGADVVALGRSDHFIPVDTEAVSPEAIALLRDWARDHSLDAIISADGDGDRPLLTDEAGQPLRGDLIGLITARFLGAGVVVTPVTSNSGIEAAGDYTTIRTRVGSPFVIEGMQKAIAQGKTGVIGFEANGGLLTASPFTVNGNLLAPLPTRDCFLPSFAVLLAARAEKSGLKAYAARFRLPVAEADRLENFPLEVSSALMSHLRGSATNLAAFVKPLGEVGAVSDIDGLRVTLKDGSVIHFRPSGNAPEMRCYVEAADDGAAKGLLARGLDLIRAFRQGHA